MAMKSSNLLSADLAPPLKNATAASSSKGASVTNNTVTESTSADKSTDKSIQTDRFSSEYEAAVKGDKTPSAEMMKKSSNDDLVEKNQAIDLKSQPGGTHVLEVKGNKEVSLDGENTAASDVVSVTDVLVSDASVINGTEQKIPVDTESKQQVMAEGEEFLNQLSVSNKQLAAPSEQDGKLLPPKTSNLDGQKNGSNVEVELPTSGLLTQNTILQQKNNPSTTKEQLTETQESGGLSEGELAKVFASSSVNNDSQQIDSSGLSSNNMLDKPDVADDANIGEGKIDNAKISTSVVATSGAVTETESEDMDVDASSPDSGQLAMAGALVMPNNEQAASAEKKASPSVQADISLSIPWSTSASIPSSAATVSAGAAASPLVASPTEAVASHSMMGVGIGIAGAAALLTNSDNTDGTQTKEINSAVDNAGLVTGMDSALNNTTPNTDNKASDFSQQLSSLSGQQSGLNMQAKSEALAQAQSPLQLSKEQAGDQVSERINMMMSKNLKHVDIRLDPPELGKLQIRLSLNQDQASVQFTVGNQQTRDLVEHSMPRLREMLHQQGLQLAQSSVQQDTSRQAFSGQSGQQNQNDSGAQQSGNHSGNGSHAGGNNHDDNVTSGGETVDMYVKPADDRVDYYA
ncbi:flagellar hook-length control protein FliK [Photobacterium indicum]|uniref:Flagellar hook-length control protein FliK n=2 Tax=Photobacterium indicum TaxID=81447 RepID=A0A2T3LBK9_9GAMM|nr:flagellar hook-length control protein FliK [Photobacterium indicum]